MEEPHRRRPDLRAQVERRSLGQTYRGHSGRRRSLPLGDRDRRSGPALGLLGAEREARQAGRANFEIFARVIQNEAPGTQVQISNDPGSDIDPVAATDANGNVWVAWQGWRDGKAAIFAASESGDKFSAPAAVSQSSGNEWNPAIAADKSGRVTVAWDSYRNRELRRLSAHGCRGAWGAETASGGQCALRSLSIDRVRRGWALVGGVRRRRQGMGQGLRRLQYQRRRGLSRARDPLAWI